MSKTGHIVVAAAVGTTIVIVQPHFAILGFIAAIAGTIPDVAEGVIGFAPDGERWSLIPHRTVTHSPWLWLALLIVGLFLPTTPTPLGHLEVGYALAGIGAGALIHLALDLFSPSGIPLANPFGARTSIGPYLSGSRRFLYRTGTAEELPLILPFALLLAASGTRLYFEFGPIIHALIP